MSNIKSNNFLINLDWKKELFQDLYTDGEDYALAGERLVYLFLSMENIIRQGGGQVFSNDPKIDYTVKSLISQLSRMRKDDSGFTEEEKDRIIAEYRLQGYSASKISTELKEKYNIILTDGGVRKRRGWTDYYKYDNQDNQS